MRFRFTLTNDILGSHILTKDPIGWDKAEILFKRSPKYHGVFYEKSIDLEFYCGAGKEYIDEVFESQGIDAVINIRIEIACSSNGVADSLDYSIDYSDDYGSEATGLGSVTFEELYLGKLDLKTRRTINGKSSINIIQEGITQTVLNRMDTVIDVTRTDTLDGTALAGLTPYDLTLHSKLIRLKSGMDIEEDAGYTFTQESDKHYTTVYLEMPFDNLIYDEFAELLMPVDPYVHGWDNPGPDPVDVYWTNDSVEKVITINYNFEGTVVENLYAGVTAGNYEFYLVIVKADLSDLLSTYTELYTHNYGTFVRNTGYTHNFSDVGTLLSVTIEAGYSVWALIELRNAEAVSIGSDVPNAIVANFTSCSIGFTWDSTTDSTTSKAFLLPDVFNKIFSSIADQENAFVSDYFNDCGAKRAITNGALIRNFPIESFTDPDGTLIPGRPVKISANELFDSFNAIDNIGMGIEKDGEEFRVRVDTKDFFYNDTVLFQLSNVPNIEYTEGSEYYYNRANIGYEKWETQSTNGIDEFNTERQYDLGLKCIDNPLTAISKIIASGYVLETARRKQFIDSSTEDFDFDNDNFVICLNQSDNTIAEKNENFSAVGNLISPETSYNLRISPARNFVRWSNVVNGGLLKYEGREIKFTSGKGNFKMESDFISDSCPGRWNNVLFSEGQNIQWDDANNSDNNPIWIPKIVSFDYPLTRTQATTLMNNPHGVIEISSTSENYVKYYILEVRYRPVGGLTEFKLLKKWVS
jgi:hypothetical protein